jgi:hypothetical protein
MSVEPNKQFLIELARALTEAEHPNIAGRLCAGLLWAIWPHWYDRNWRHHREPDVRSS